MTKIIGHRGAAGLALENTIEAIQAAVNYKVDAIEVDVRATKDKQLVLSHDKHLSNVSAYNTIISDITLDDLIGLTLHNKKPIALLEDAIKTAGDIPLIIEIKEPDVARPLLKVLHKTQAKGIIITSLWHDELRVVRKLRPDIPVLVRDMLSPFDIVATAHNMGATGINLNAWQMNPLTYWLAKRYNLDVMVYTVNEPFIADFLHRLYPGIMICTNRPDRFARHRTAWQKRTRSNQTLENKR